MAPTKKSAPSKASSSASRAKHSRGTSMSGSSPNKRAENWNFTHVPPQASQRTGNGRQKGRDLVSWARPRMMEQTMLHLVYEATTRNIRLPWDNIAHRLHPGLSGNALLQRFQRLRRELIAEGHLVPPLPGRGNSNMDPEIRGVTRLDRDGPDLETTRPVRFDEPWLAPAFNLPDAGRLVHNQTTARKGGKDATAFQLGSDDESDSEEPDFDALDSGDDGKEQSDEEEDDNEDEDDVKEEEQSRRASVSRRQSVRASQKKKTYAEFDSDDEQEPSKKKSTLDRRNRAGSSSPLARRRNGNGRRSTTSSTTQPMTQQGLNNVPAIPTSSQPVSSTGITLSQNPDGSFMFAEKNADGTLGQSFRIAAPVPAATPAGGQTGTPQDSFAGMLAQMLTTQQQQSAQGASGMTSVNSSQPSSIFTGRHFNFDTPASSFNASGTFTDVPMGGMNGGVSSQGPNASSAKIQLNPEQHHLAMQILKHDRDNGGSGSRNANGNGSSKQPVRRSQRRVRTPSDNHDQDSVEVKTEDPSYEDGIDKVDAPLPKRVPGLRKEKMIRDSHGEDDMDES